MKQLHIVNLKIISRIDEHQKISTVSNNDISIDSNDMLQGVRRYVWNDCKCFNTVSKINH